MATSEIKLKPKMGWESAILATGITRYLNRDTKMCALVFTGYQVLSSGFEGNAGSISPITVSQDMFCTVSTAGAGSALIKVSAGADGKLSLLNTSIANYISGTVYGCIMFPIN